MNELTLDGKTYVSSKRAAEMTGYAKDYVGQLCREGRVEARLVGRNWYILKSAIEKHRFNAGETSGTSGSGQGNEPSALGWENPKYRLDEPVDLPAVHKPAESSDTEPTSMEAMQDAWRSWFARDVAAETTSEIVGNAQEAPEEPVSDETSVPLHPIASSAGEHEALNLRRIREFNPEDTAEEDAIPTPVGLPRHAKAPSSSSYRIFQAIFVLVALIAIGIGYVGAGFLTTNSVSGTPVNMLAGVSVYNLSR